VTAAAEPIDQRLLLVRLPCNPIFPVGPIYLADHLQKQCPQLEQRILDLAALPLLDVERVLLATVEQFRPTLLVFSWRDIQIYAPVDGRGGNPLQNSFEVFYARNPLKRLRGALGGVRLMASHYGELWRNLRLLRRGLADTGASPRTVGDGGTGSGCGPGRARPA